MAGSGAARAAQGALRIGASALGCAFAAGAAAALWIASDSIFLGLAAAVIAARLAAPLIGLRAHGGDAATLRSAKPSPVIGRDRLLAGGDELLQRCRTRQQPLSLAVVQVSELAEVRHLFGERVAEGVMQRLQVKLQAIAGRQGLAARTSGAQFALLLPGLEAEHALIALRSAFGRAGTLEHDSEEHELLLLPEFKVDTVGAEHEAIAAPYDALCAALPVPAPASVPTHATPAGHRAPQPPLRPGRFPTTIPVALEAR